MQLSPCSACRRHISTEAASCPFCAASLAKSSPATEPFGRLSRAAVFAAATLATGAMTACWTNKSEPKHAEQTAVTPDAAVAPAPDAAVPQNVIDDDNRQYQNHPCVDTPQGPMCAPYGAPPARRRFV